MNKYAQFSKAPEDKDDMLLTWKLTFDRKDWNYKLVFSDGEKRTFSNKKEATRYINEKFFSTYF